MSNATARGASYAYGDQMAAYDKLPPSFRAVLANADFCWAATTCLARFRKARPGYRSPTEFKKTVRGWDRKQAKRW